VGADDLHQQTPHVVRQISQNIANATETKAFSRWDPSWVRVVERHVGAWSHAEHGLGMHVFLPAQRDAPTTCTTMPSRSTPCTSWRFAQDLILYNLALSDELPDFDGGSPRGPGGTIRCGSRRERNVERINRHQGLG